MSNLVPFEVRQHAKRRCDFLSGPVGFVSEGAEEGHAVTLLNGVRNLEVERLLEALDAGKDLGEGLGPLVSARPGLDFLEFGVVEVQRNVSCVRRHELSEHLEIRCVLQKLLKHGGQIISVKPPSSERSTLDSVLAAPPKTDGFGNVLNCAYRFRVIRRWRSPVHCVRP